MPATAPAGESLFDFVEPPETPGTGTLVPDCLGLPEWVGSDEVDLYDVDVEAVAVSVSRRKVDDAVRVVLR